MNFCFFPTKICDMNQDDRSELVRNDPRYANKKTTYHGCIGLFLLLLLFAVLDLLCDFSFGLSDELSERSAISDTCDKRMLCRRTKTKDINMN